MAESKTASTSKKSISTKKVLVKKKTAVSVKKTSPAKKTSIAKKTSSAKKITPAKKTATKKVAKRETVTEKIPVEKTLVEKTPVEKTSVEKTPVKKTTQAFAEIDLQAMFEAGCHFGHKIAKWHPKMQPFIYGSEGGSHIFDLEKSAEQLNIACQRFYDLAKEGKTLLMIGTKRSAREIIKEAASEMGCFYIVSRWMGGLLTNFHQLQKSIQRMNDIETGLESGKFDKYTKYERLQLDKEKTRLERFFIGLKGLKGKPDCVFVVDPEKEKIVVKESVSEGVELIAIADSNADPRKIDIVIPANDDASKSVHYIVNCLKTAYNAGKTASK